MPSITAKRGDVVFDPMPGKIVVRLLEETEYSEHIIVPAKYQTVRVLGQVMAVGRDEPDGDTFYPLAVGDTVAFNSTAGIQLTIDREQVLILRVTEILTKVRWKLEAMP